MNVHRSHIARGRWHLPSCQLGMSEHAARWAAWLIAYDFVSRSFVSASSVRRALWQTHLASSLTGRGNDPSTPHREASLWRHLHSLVCERAAYSAPGAEQQIEHSCSSTANEGGTALNFVEANAKARMVTRSAPADYRGAHCTARPVAAAV